MNEINAAAPINQDVMFSNHKGKHKKRLEKKQQRLLQKVICLKKLMGEDEEILLITTASSPVSLLEQLVTGWVAFQLKASIVVFTNKRIIQVLTGTAKKYQHRLAEIHYGDCAAITAKARSFTVNYTDGRKETFPCLRYASKKKLRSVLAMLPIGQGSANEKPQRTSLCPSCAVRLQRDRYTCPGCGLVFKDRAKARKIALLIPGGGYFYCGHPFLGIADALGECLLIGMLISSTVASFSNPEAVPAAVVLALALVYEKVISCYHTDHFVQEFIPESSVGLPPGPVPVANPAPAPALPETLVAQLV